nr:transposon TX1 [Tanacetum cinerariifolium]
MGPGVGNVRLESNRVNNGERYSSMANMSHRDDKMFVDVVNGRFNRPVINKAKLSNGTGVQTQNKEGFVLNREEKWTGRAIEVEVLDVNGVLLGRSVVGEVKSRCFLSKISLLCEEQGLGEIEVKLLEGLEVMIVMENENTAANMLSDKEHGLRRWMYKLRRGDTLHRTSGRITSVSCWGEEHGLRRWMYKLRRGDTLHRTSGRITFVSCWGEGTFKKIAALHGTILGMQNCRLEGNQNLVDDKEDGDEGQSNSEGSESGKDEDYDDEHKRLYSEGGGTVPDFEDRNGGEDEGSRFSGETKVVDTLEGEYGSSKEEVYEEYKYSRGDDSEKSKKKGGGIDNEEVDKSIEEINEEGDKSSEMHKDVSNLSGGNMGNTRGNEDINFVNNIGGLELGSNKEGANGLEIKEDGNIKGINRNGPSSRCVGHNEHKGLIKKRMVYNRQQVSQEGIKVDVEKNEELAQDSLTTKRDKREVFPSCSTGSGGGRLRKKRKAISEGVFEVNGEELSFNQGKISGTKCEDKSKKKIGRCVTKAMHVARKNGTEELGESKKGASDAYKEYQEVGNVNNGIFHFGSGKKDEDAIGRCHVSIEQVKEIREKIGVS